MSEPAQIRPILPGQSADLEIELEKALSHIETVEIPIRTLWDPWRCPLVALPYLAWALSVDQWESSWPETTKRRVVASSLDLHRIKGTRPAVEMALEALGVKVDIVEWFETEIREQPGTFALTAWVTENLTSAEAGLLNEEVYRQIRVAVDNAKNLRSHYTFKVGAQFEPATVSAGATMGAAAIARREAEARQDPIEPFQATLGAGGAMGGAAIARREAAAMQGPLEPCRATLGPGGVVSCGYALLRVDVRPRTSEEASLSPAALCFASAVQSVAIVRSTLHFE